MLRPSIKRKMRSSLHKVAKGCIWMPRGKKVSDDVRRFIVYLKRDSPELTYSEIKERVEVKFPVEIDQSTVGRILQGARQRGGSSGGAIVDPDGPVIPEWLGADPPSVARAIDGYYDQLMIRVNLADIRQKGGGFLHRRGSKFGSEEEIVIASIRRHYPALGSLEHDFESALGEGNFQSAKQTAGSIRSDLLDWYTRQVEGVRDRP